MLKRIWPFIIGSIALGLDAYIIAGLLPTMAKDLETSEALVGLGVTAFTGAYAISGPLWAGPAGRQSARGLTIALTVFAIGNLITAFAPNIFIFLLARVIAGAAAGIYSPLSTSVAASMVVPERRGQALSMVLAGLAIGTVFGVPIGLFLAQVTSWRFSMGLITLIGVFALIGIRFHRGEKILNVDAPNLTARLQSISATPNLLIISVTFLTGIASLGLYTYISPVLSASTLSNHQTLAIWIWGLGGAIGVLSIGKIVDRAQKSTTITTYILVALAISLTLLGLISNATITLLMLLTWGMLGWSSLAPQQHTLLATNPDDGTTAVAANSSANYLGAAVGSALGALAISAGFTGLSLPLLAVVPIIVAVILHIIRIRLFSVSTSNT